MNTGPALSILARCRRLGIRLENRGGRIWATPSAKLTDELRADLRANRAAILAALALLARREPAPGPETDVDPPLDDVSSREQAEVEWRRFWEAAVQVEPGVWRDPKANDTEALAAIRGGGFSITTDWIERARAGLPNVREPRA